MVRHNCYAIAHHERFLYKILYFIIAILLSCTLIPLFASVEVPVAIGELIDKITILEIKAERIKDSEKLKKINFELEELNERLKTIIIIQPGYKSSQFRSFERYRKNLKQINETLWDIEDKIREKEARKEFDDEFIDLARSVYKTNDQRCSIKRKINILCKSEIIEEKSYKKYE